MANPAAASCSDPHLLRVLKRYDKKDEHRSLVLLESLRLNASFLYNNNRVFIKGERQRTRYRCKELHSGQVYLFSGLTEVEVLE